MNPPVITVNQLTRRFHGTAEVKHLSLEVHAGEIFGFLGHNGAGKITTMRLLNGVIEPDSGSMTVLELDPQADGHALLYTPTTDQELFVAKLLSSWLLAIAVALVGFALYVVMANAAAWSQMQRIFFPMADLAKGYEKDKTKLEENLRQVYHWRDEVKELEKLVA